MGSCVAKGVALAPPATHYRPDPSAEEALVKRNRERSFPLSSGSSLGILGHCILSSPRSGIGFLYVYIVHALLQVTHCVLLVLCTAIYIYVIALSPHLYLDTCWPLLLATVAILFSLLPYIFASLDL